MRNIEKQIQQAEKFMKKHPNINLTESEIIALIEIYEKESNSMQGVYEVICAAFFFGIAVGVRNSK